MSKKTIYEMNVNAHLLPYLEYGDYSGLEMQDIEVVDECLNKNKYLGVVNEESTFDGTCGITGLFCNALYLCKFEERSVDEQLVIV